MLLNRQCHFNKKRECSIAADSDTAFSVKKEKR